MFSPSPAINCLACGNIIIKEKWIFWSLSKRYILAFAIGGAACVCVCVVLARRSVQKWLCSTDQLHRELRMNHRIPLGKSWSLNLPVISWASKGGRRQGRAWCIHALLLVGGDTSPATFRTTQKPKILPGAPRPCNSAYLSAMRDIAPS